MDKKYITKYQDKFCILVPVFYLYEDKPAWRKYFVGTKEECESLFPSCPDSLKATEEEEKRNKQNVIRLVDFYNSIKDYRKINILKNIYPYLNN